MNASAVTVQARSMPNSQNNNFTAMKNKHPSMLNPKITPGNFTNPQEIISTTISPTKLFLRNKQETKVKMEMANKTPIAYALGLTFTDDSNHIVRAKTNPANIPPQTKAFFLCLTP